MLRCVAVALCSLVLSTSAFAQVMYEPVRYQYETSRGEKYLYGGVDPRVHAVAGYYGACGFHGYAMNLHNFDGGNSFNQPSPMYQRDVVFTDCIPFRDARLFGYTQADARNEAYANSPTYFRKADLLESAIPTATGGWVVPANAPNYVPVMRPTVNVHPTMMRSTTSPAGARPGQVIIIPKRLMDKKIKDLEEKPLKVASAK
jgi:hypothetical protein